MPDYKPATCENCDCHHQGTKIKTTESVWVATSDPKFFPPLAGDTAADVCIIGGGITGLTAAYLLTKAGKKVVLVEMARLGSGVTGYTTAHLTAVLDIRYRDLVRHVGEETARDVAQSCQQTIGTIEHIVEDLHLECDYQRVDGYLYTESENEVATLQDEARVAHHIGLPAGYVSDVPLPFATIGGVRFGEQGQLHPLKYIHGLARAVTEAGGVIHEKTRALKITGTRVVTDHGTITAHDVIMATHTPLTAKLLTVQSKLSPARSYVLGVRLADNAPAPHGLFWDTDEPYHYIRTHQTNDGPVVIVGGEDHPTGSTTNTQHHVDCLQAYVQEHFAGSTVEYAWSAQVFNPVDMLPYIGKAPFISHTYIATGYAGNGLTFGTLGAQIVSDHILGRANAVAHVYRPGRLTIASIAKLTQYGINNARHFMVDRLKKAQGTSINDVAPGEGKIVALEGKKTAVYKDAQGVVTKLSPICTHAGCTVQWNAAEKSWDCPCHGSRFSSTGGVVTGPAVEDLKVV